jgi:spore coat protein CotH
VGVFDDTRVHDVKLTMSPEDWQSIIADSRGDEWRHATLEYDGVVVEDVGVHPSGEGSRFPGNQKMAL